MTMQAKAQVYISEKSTGHSVTFLIINEDSVIMECYNLQLKLLPVNLTRNVKAYQIINNTEKIIKTNKLEIVKKARDTLCSENINYLLHYKFAKCGDFAKLDSSFGNLNTIEKLNVCRNCYFLLHPPKEIEVKLKEYPKKGLKITEDVNCRQDHTVFLKDLLKIIKQ